MTRGRHDHSKVLSVASLKAALPTRLKAFLRRSFLRLSALANIGSRVACPCCGGRFRKFARFHGLNDQCPSCGSLMRQRAVTLYLRDVLNVPETGGQVLHIGPANAIREWMVSIPSVRYVSSDIDPHVADVQADITDLPFRDDSFDLIVCLHVLEHVPDDKQAVRELYRVLRPGGKAVVQVPPSPFEETLEDKTVTSPSERERLFGQYDHVRLAGADYIHRLEEPGFDVEREDHAADLDLTTRNLYAVHPGEPFYVCVKAAGS
jgi:SAM-dependent methyltransferase